MEMTFIAKIHSFTRHAKLWREIYKNIFKCYRFSLAPTNQKELG